MKDKTINSILIPTDFSELGDFAYDLASLIAAKSGATIEIISVVPGPQGAFYSNRGVLLNDEGNDYSEWSKKLDLNREKMKLWTSEKAYVIDTFCTIGEIDNTIIQYAEDHEIDLIIMGTEGLFNNSLWNPPSHAQYITNHSPIPVLTLKCDRSDLKMDEVLLAGDFLEAKDINLTIIKSLQSLFNSKLILLKIKTDDAKRTDEQITNDMNAFAKANGLNNYEIHIYKDKMVESGIGKFSAERDIDLICLGTHQGRGFSKLFKRSISDDIVNHLFHPILTFPIH